MRTPFFTFLRDPTQDQIRQITAFYRIEGWWPAEAPDDPSVVRGIVRGSHCFAVALTQGEIIAMGRAISDGASDAYIQDLAVKKDYRRSGIGSKLLDMIINRLLDDGINWIGVVAERDTHAFYENKGFRAMQNALPLLRHESR